MAVVGLGASGRAAADLCLRHGARVVGLDELLDEARLVAPLVELRERGLELETGPLERLERFDLVVVSPGMPPRAAIERAEAAGVEVIGELELASRFVAAPIVLIGGTNGKSTVTALVGQMLAASGLRTFVGGNFGTPLVEAESAAFDVCVVEISSFQAERVPSLRARAHALLNVSEDHLDRYPSFAAYADAKGNPFSNMQAEDWAIVPTGDAVCAAQAARGKAALCTFGLEDGDVRREGRELVDHRSGARFPVASLAIHGRHNLANACAAIATAGAMGATEEAIFAALTQFRGLPHRQALVAEIDGVRFYDDSKATNVGAAVAALSGLEEPRAVLIAGGRDKQGSYAPLVAALREKGRALVVIGEAAEVITSAALGVVPVVQAATMQAAVDQAAALAEPGDAVLLSPACSSYDMFTSYAERGDHFAEAVLSLRGGGR